MSNASRCTPVGATAAGVGMGGVAVAGEGGRARGVPSELDGCPLEAGVLASSGERVRVTSLLRSVAESSVRASVPDYTTCSRGVQNYFDMPPYGSFM